MKKRVYGILLLALLPMISEVFVDFVGNYGIGLVVRLFVHLVVPVLAVSYVLGIGYKKAFLMPLQLKNKKVIFYQSLIGSIGAIAIIVGALFIFLKMLDFGSIAGELSKIGVNKLTYPFVALTIAIVNPFMEEYFWRGFVFRVFAKYTNIWFAYATGVLFALHHMLIVGGWFNWWQFLLVTSFLAVVGVLFNYSYHKTGSIYASWIVHMVADIVIVVIGWFLVF